MKVITEALLRLELRASEPETYYIEPGKILSPAAREYLQQRRIKIVHSPKEDVASKEDVSSKEKRIEEVKISPLETSKGIEYKFIDYETDAYYSEKPEHMTHLYGNVLVAKHHPRIIFRGKLDSLQALVVLNQTILYEKEDNKKIVEDLSQVLGRLRNIMRCDVMNEELKQENILGLNHDELRERSHDPMKFYNIKPMVLPDYTLGKNYALLNQIRAAIRETETAAAEAFRVGTKCTRPDLIEELNRLSSTVHIMMCIYLTGQYQ